ncbi:MAG: PQQ-binding-like beta-propeller repeat protein [Phycisphaerae bacterium]
MSTYWFSLRSLAVVVWLALLVAVAPAVGGDDWPQFLGPNRDGITSESDWRARWGSAEPDTLWQRPVGTGHGGISIRDGRLYTIGNVDNERDVVWCLSADDGEVVWTQSYPQKGGGSGHPGPRCTPTLDGDYVYTLSIEGRLLCLDDSRDGEVVWSKNVKKDFSGKPGSWGFACSPLVLGEKLIVDVGTVVALDKRTGEKIWSSGDYQAGYSSPVAFEHDGRTLLAVFNAFGLVILDAEDGAELASYRWKTSYEVNAALPLIHGDRIFITSGYGTGGALLKLTDNGLEEIWKSKTLGSHFSSVILRDGYLYGFDGNVGGARMKCVEFETGREMWAQRLSGAMILAGDKFLVQEQSGGLLVVNPDPQGYQELSSIRLPRDKWWNIPVLLDGRIYCRSHAGKMVCLDVSTDK